MKVPNKALLAACSTALLAACGGGGGGIPSAPSTPSTPSTPGSFGCNDTSVVQDLGSNVRSLQGRFCSDLTLDQNITYVLNGFVNIGGGNVNLSTQADIDAARAAGVTLTIPAGTNILGNNGSSLIVNRGSRIVANGTAAAPITFSSTDAGFDGQAEWGGLIIQGFAPQYTAEARCDAATPGICNVQGEGGPVGFFGGDIADDNSGVMRYVRIAEGGLVAGPGNEVNGLTLMGVGHGTTLEFIQVHNNRDDAVEWFGGTVNARYLVLTSNDDDDIDFDEGYQGNIQHALIIKAQAQAAPFGSNDPRGIEANSDNNDAVPQTRATLANITIIGGNASNQSDQNGMRLRGDVKVNIFNSVVDNWNDGCIRSNNAVVDGQLVNPGNSTMVQLTNVLGDCVTYFDGMDGVTAVNSANVGGGITFDANFAVVEAAAQNLPVAIMATDNGSNFVFDNAPYAGAVDPATPAGMAWWAGWTIPGSVNVADLVANTSNQ